MSANGGRASRNKLPDPLQSSLGTWAPPAVSLSATSAGVGLLVLGFLQRNADLRGLFNIAIVDNPSHNRAIAIGLALFAAALAWRIALRCRLRPGPLWPRLWALSLALAATAVAALQCLGPPPAWMSLADAADAACFAAVLALWPRLLRLPPDSPWVQRVAPASLVLVLLAVLPTLYFMGGDVIAVWRHGLDGAVSALRGQTADFARCADAPRGCSETEYRAALERLAGVVDNPSFRDIPARFHDQAAMASRQAALAEAQAALLDRLAVELPRRLTRQLAATAEGRPGAGSPADTLADFKALWAVALPLGKQAPLGQAYGELLDALIASAPPLLREAPVVYTSSANDGPWDNNLAFDTASRQVAGYYGQLKSWLAELGAVAPPLQAVYWQKYHGDWERRLQAMETSWAEHWLLPYLADPPAETGQALPWLPLSKVLRMPVIGDLAAGQVGGLLELSRSALEKQVDAQHAANCEKKQRDDKTLSLHCRSYVATALDKTALRVELRLIYELKKNPGKPDRLFFFLPVPPSSNLESFAFELENALPESRPALQQLLKAVNLQKSIQAAGRLDIPPQCPPKTGSACAEVWEYAKDSGQDYIKLVIYRH